MFLRSLTQNPGSGVSLLISDKNSDQHKMMRFLLLLAEVKHLVPSGPSPAEENAKVMVAHPASFSAPRDGGCEDLVVKKKEKPAEK